MMNTDSSYDKSLNIRHEVLKRRYLLKDEQGNIIETPEQMFQRVASTIADIELKHGATEKDVQDLAQVFCRLMLESKFLPNSPTLMNAGRPNGMLSACFVLPVNDSITEIFETVKNTALIQKAGGGTGFAFDTLRPTGDIVHSSGGTTSGPISFWRVLAETTHAIQQGAHRRGANMGMMSVKHPDILQFITAKQNLESFTNFNISVKVPDVFMKALRENPNTPHIVINPRTQQRYIIPRDIDVHSYQLQHLKPTNGDTNGCYSIKDIWEMVVRNAHATGEPGICFIDRVNEGNPTPKIGIINATNPCGEQPLLDYESCNLGSLNIPKFVQPDGKNMDWQAFGKAVELAVWFLDNVIDANYWPIPQIQEATLGNRKIGLGIMGFADTLILLGIRYDTDEAVTFAEQLSQFIQNHAHRASQKLAEQREIFPNWPGSIWDTEHHKPMRNAACTTIAPTGTISIIAGCSSGIEPIYSVVTERRALDGSTFLQIHPLIEELGLQQGWMNEKVKTMLMAGASIDEIPGFPKKLTDVLVTAHEVDSEWHVRIQAAFQSYIDNAVSKTVNLPANATIDEVDKTFQLAYDLRCKGVTVYRDASRKEQVLSSTIAVEPAKQLLLGPRPRSRVTTGQTSKFRMGCGTLFVTVNRDDRGVCEVFANLGKAGGCPSQSEATCRVVSAALRSGVDPKVLIDQLSSIRCLSAAVARKANKGVDVLSCPDAIARAIEEAIGSADNNKITSIPRICEECHRPMRREANCGICDYCGVTKCGG